MRTVPSAGMLPKRCITPLQPEPARFPVLPALAPKGLAILTLAAYQIF